MHLSGFPFSKVSSLLNRISHYVLFQQSIIVCLLSEEADLLCEVCQKLWFTVSSGGPAWASGQTVTQGLSFCLGCALGQSWPVSCFPLTDLWGCPESPARSPQRSELWPQEAHQTFFLLALSLRPQETLLGDLIISWPVCLSFTLLHYALMASFFVRYFKLL